MKIWRHKKRGTLYVVLTNDATIEATMERATIYASLSDGALWIRPHSEFYDGRFERLNRMVNADGETRLSISEEF